MSPYFLLVNVFRDQEYFLDYGQCKWREAYHEDEHEQQATGHCDIWPELQASYKEFLQQILFNPVTSWDVVTLSSSPLLLSLKTLSVRVCGCFTLEVQGYESVVEMESLAKQWVLYRSEKELYEKSQGTISIETVGTEIDDSIVS